MRFSPHFLFCPYTGYNGGLANIFSLKDMSPPQKKNVSEKKKEKRKLPAG